ncbi:hypothetical protein N7478_010808 [Penicillium angulare]|uniref:uncharacterized protein n=1 Tax=Penicillium angulare TaxID=116970 RepID=UPI0025422345|nr:uncharacterized protein N7478_010808 [Penicillium angulare]KAJ5263203.1 hypothetical protein N7478_010808 [Penicillium angulare]
MTTTAANWSNFGPLTTTFTPSPDCFTEKWIRQTSVTAILSWGEFCTTSDSTAELSAAPSCFPTGIFNAQSSVTNWGTMNEVFSPGYYCPYGWSAAYNTTYGSGYGWYNLGAQSVTLGTDDIVTACCPEGYHIGTTACLKYSTTVGDRPSIGAYNNGSCVTRTIGTFTGAIGTNTGVTATFEAPALFLLRNTASSTSTASSATQTAGSSSSSTSSGLSTGAKIAIGVCIPVVVLTIAAVCFIIWHRRRKSKSGHVDVDVPPTLQTHDLGGSGGGIQSELDSGTPVVSEIANSPHEMSDTTKTPYEMTGDQLFEVDGEHRWELAGDSIMTSAVKKPGMSQYEPAKELM